MLRRALSTHGRGWFEKYRREGPEGFRVGAAQKPFDWSAQPRGTTCYLDVAVDGAPAGRLEIELLDELLPRTAENFRLLCSGDAPSGASYRGSVLARRVVRGVGLLGGALPAERGGTRSAFAEGRFFADEGFFVPHAEPGLVSMANSGADTNGSQFYLTREAAPHLDGRCVAFGRLVAGRELVDHLVATLYTQRGVPVEQVTVRDCGVL
mmetsp:Transcript_4343/g.12846  ORF Transcript_4343/g.12846 Transcript_4343/m.12846 type:complete len:209 (-) Transcript_4343:22-648(-)